jgi:hypothetical protein
MSKDNIYDLITALLVAKAEEIPVNFSEGAFDDIGSCGDSLESQRSLRAILRH